MSRKLTFHYTLTRITGTLHEDLCTFMITPRSVLVGMRNVRQEMQKKSKPTFYVQYPPPQNNRAVYEIMWKIMVNPERSQITV